MAFYNANIRYINGNPYIPGATGIGPIGLTGATGSQGNQGATGLEGARGFTGAEGPTGQAGINGVSGPTGSTGVRGLRGVPGFTGATGVSGLSGDIGATGEQGPRGFTGAQGPQGASGSTGSAGAQGPTGLQGPPGDEGPTGASGAQGPTGLQGPPGDEGPIGATGVEGPTGQPGVLAYAEMTIISNVASQTLTNASTYYTWTTDWTEDQTPVNMTTDLVNGVITPNITAELQTNITINFASNTATGIRFSLFKNDDIIPDHLITMDVLPSQVGYALTCTITGIDNATSGDDYNLRVLSGTAGTQVTIFNANMNFHAISGTVLGPQGDQGATGASGPAGSGSTGATGIQGPTGPVSPYGPPNVTYVSSIYGNDLTGDGSFELPFATINHCISVGSAPSTQLVILCVDGSTFTEIISLVGGTYINAPFATITNGTSSTTVTNTAGHNWLTVSYINNTGGGNAIENLTGATFHVDAQFCLYGDIVNSATSGDLVLRSFQVLNNINNATTGNFIADMVLSPGGATGVIYSNWSNSLTPSP
jgi:hypothetical protein